MKSKFSKLVEKQHLNRWKATLHLDQLTEQLLQSKKDELTANTLQNDYFVTTLCKKVDEKLYNVFWSVRFVVEVRVAIIWGGEMTTAFSV